MGERGHCNLNEYHNIMVLCILALLKFLVDSCWSCIIHSTVRTNWKNAKLFSTIKFSRFLSEIGDVQYELSFEWDHRGSHHSFLKQSVGTFDLFAAEGKCARFKITKYVLKPRCIAKIITCLSV